MAGLNSSANTMAQEPQTPSGKPPRASKGPDPSSEEQPTVLRDLQGKEETVFSKMWTDMFDTVPERPTMQDSETKWIHPTNISMQGTMGLSAPRKRKMTKSLTRVIIYVIIRRVLDGHLKEKCLGCKMEFAAQYGHTCVTWDKNTISKHLREVSLQLCIKNILHTIILISYGLKTLQLNSEHVNQTLKIITGLSCSEQALDLLNNLMKPGDTKYLDYVQKAIRKRPYKWFLSFVENDGESNSAVCL